MYVVTFAQPLPDGTYNVRDLRRMSLLEARALAAYAWPRRGTIVNIINEGNYWRKCESERVS